VARDLLPLGYHCVLYDQDAAAGGMMRTQIPKFRLPETVLDEEVNYILDLKPELRLGNIMRASLADMYNSPRAVELWDWERFGTPEFCKNCTFHIPVSRAHDDPSLLSDPHQMVGAG